MTITLEYVQQYSDKELDCVLRLLAALGAIDDFGKGEFVAGHTAKTLAEKVSKAGIPQ